MTDTTTESLGRFGHHPDPAIDFCIEVDALEGMALDIKAGLDDAEAFKARLSRALEFRVGGDEGAVRAKDGLRKLAAEVSSTGSPPDEYAIVEIFGHRRHGGRIPYRLPGTTDRPKIVVLCGSSRFVDIMAVCTWLIERDEQAIAMGLHLLPDWYSAEPIPDHLAEHEGVAAQMDALHLRKIDLASEVFVINFDNYIGDSTRNEIAYAKSRGTPIRWFTHDPIGQAVMARLRARRDREERPAS